MIKSINLPYPEELSGGVTLDTVALEAMREKMKKMLMEKEYGALPKKPLSVSYEVLEESKTFCAGNATLKKILLTVTTEEGSFSFPIYEVVPKRGEKFNTVVHINFRDAVPDRYMPSEEIVDNGLAVVSFCYKDVTSDEDDFSDGLASLLCGADRSRSDSGKIMLWAWAAMRVLDYIETQSYAKNVIVAGHSRLGKTALVAGAFDERFALAYSNDSGCGGAAISRDKVGERVARINKVYGYWFSKKYAECGECENEQLFDQHWLLGLMAPRRVYVASAEEDEWADPVSEYLSCQAASEFYRACGEEGFIAPDTAPRAESHFHDGKIGYHIRHGVHYFSRRDWLFLMEYIKKHF